MDFLRFCYPRANGADRHSRRKPGTRVLIPLSYLPPGKSRFPNLRSLGRKRRLTIDILIDLHYSLLYSFLTYALVSRGNTYHTTINPLAILQKIIVRIITFSNYCADTNPLFIQLKIIKFHEHIFITRRYSCMTITLAIFLNHFMIILY
jgi:hypothetical protein